MVHERYMPVKDGEAPGCDPDADAEMRGAVMRTIRDVTRDLEQFAFNTAVSFIMELVNAIYQYSVGDVDTGVMREAVEAVISLLAPFAPFISEELWHELGNDGSVHALPWPTFDEEVAKRKEVTLIVQVNGKVRDKITVPADIGEEKMREMALASENTRKHVEGKDIRKVIIVPGKLVNIVV
jgi:leucyl-tRNA synthetase